MLFFFNSKLIVISHNNHTQHILKAQIIILEKHRRAPEAHFRKQMVKMCLHMTMPGWLHGTAVERQSLAGELSLFCA